MERRCKERPQWRTVWRWLFIGFRIGRVPTSTFNKQTDLNSKLLRDTRPWRSYLLPLASVLTLLLFIIFKTFFRILLFKMSQFQIPVAKTSLSLFWQMNYTQKSTESMEVTLSGNHRCRVERSDAVMLWRIRNIKKNISSLRNPF